MKSSSELTKVAKIMEPSTRKWTIDDKALLWWIIARPLLV